jgi:hypothetical protein
MTKLVNFLAVVAVLFLGTWSAGAAELMTDPGIASKRTVRYSSGYPFIGWRPSFEYTTGFRYYHAEPYFLGPVPACGVITEPVRRRGEWVDRQVYRCW